MASIYDKASLVLIPSGTKTSKVYSQKPVNGDGDFTFSRSTAATRVNADGNIEKETQNLVLHSSDQSNAIYTIQTGINTVTAVSNPLTGNNDAYKIVKTSGHGDPYFGQNISTSVNGCYTGSMYLWTDSGQPTDCQIFLYDGNTAEVFYKSFTITTTPTRYEFFVNFASVNSEIRFRLDLSATTDAYLYTYGWQLEYGLAARDYIETTTAAVEGGITDNVPRLDYTDSSCPALLLEPQRTNLAALSEYFEGWSHKVNTTATSNYTTSPEGVQNATRLQFTANGYLYNTNAPAQVNGAQHTLSCYAKRNDSGTQSFGFFTNGSGSLDSAMSLTSEWQRFTYTYTATNASQLGLAGLSGADVSVFGFQVEASASYATSYIPTYGTSVTRNKDVAARYTLDNLVFNPSESWSFLYEAKFPAYTSGSAPIIHFDIAGTTNDIYLFANYTGSNMGINVYLGAGNGGYPFGFGANDAGILNQRNKMCLTYDGDALKYFINGSLFNSTTGVSFTEGTTSIKFNSFGTLPVTAVGELLTFPTALTDQEAIDLTTI